MATIAFPLVLALASTAEPQSAGDPDRDRDGLSDFQETHKHFTDPAKRDSDGDGRPDGDWDERREFAYTVRSVVRVLPPVTKDVLQDDYQDARIRRESKEFVELEVIHYPLNTVASAIEADSDWRAHVTARRDLRPFLEPGVTANFDRAMSEEVAAALKADGIDAAALDDRALVGSAAGWLFSNTAYADGFTTFTSTFARGKARVLPGLEAAAERGKNEKDLSIEEQWERELFAAGMWKHRIHGSCTSSAIFANGFLRSLGVPTRIVLCIPLVDSSDPEEVGWLASSLSHHRVRRIVSRAILPLGTSWSSHTFNEVFVGGRWRRLNYSALGQNILDPGFFGLMTHVATFGDWADGDMAKTWGWRQCRDREPNDPFGGSNPYSCVELSDQFGAHARIDNPELTEHRELTLTQLSWWSSPQRRVDIRLDDPATAGHLLATVAEFFPEEGQEQYSGFYAGVDHEFVLRADGVEDVRVHATRGYWVDAGKDLRDFYLRIEPGDLAAMNVGIPYELVPANAKPGFRWIVAGGVTITREFEAQPHATFVPEGGERVLTIDALRWSDDPALPEFVRRIAADPPRLLGRIEAWSEFAQIKEFTALGDTRFWLESEGRPALGLRVDEGGFTFSEDGRETAWIVLPLGPADWDAFARGVTYRLRPGNSKPGWRWVVAERATVPPRS